MATVAVFRAITNYQFKANETTTTASILASFPAVDALRIKSKDSENVRVNINNSLYVPTTFNNETRIATGDTYTFDKDCVVILGKYEFV